MKERAGVTMGTLVCCNHEREEGKKKKKRREGVIPSNGLWFYGFPKEKMGAKYNREKGEESGSYMKKKNKKNKRKEREGKWAC